MGRKEQDWQKGRGNEVGIRKTSKKRRRRGMEGTRGKRRQGSKEITGRAGWEREAQSVQGRHNGSGPRGGVRGTSDPETFCEARRERTGSTQDCNIRGYSTNE
eukprot:6211989-Pleurochrysis_carterae.AAC.1